MVVGTGIDLVKIERIRASVDRWDRRFLDRVFTPLEQRYALSIRNPHPHLAARFAVKEAVMKAIGTGWSGGIRWTDIELYHDPSGKPGVTVTGAVKRRIEALGVHQIHVSVSHDSEYAVGQVILIK